MSKATLITRSKLRTMQVPSVVWRMAGFALIKSLNAWMSTLSYRVVRYEREADPADELFQGPVIFVFWHEYIPFPIYLRPHCRLAMLLSQHQDAEVLSHVARFAGLEAVRGSTNRGGTAALRELLDRGKGMNLAITPDGPRGPRRQMAQGAVYLSSRLQVPLVALGVGMIAHGEIVERGTSSRCRDRLAGVARCSVHVSKFRPTWIAMPLKIIVSGSKAI